MIAEILSTLFNVLMWLFWASVGLFVLTTCTAWCLDRLPKRQPKPPRQWCRFTGDWDDIR